MAADVSEKSMRLKRTPGCLVLSACGPWAISEKDWDTQEERAVVNQYSKAVLVMFHLKGASRSVITSWV